MDMSLRGFHGARWGEGELGPLDVVDGRVAGPPGCGGRQGSQAPWGGVDDREPGRWPASFCQCFCTTRCGISMMFCVYRLLCHPSGTRGVVVTVFTSLFEAEPDEVCVVP